MNSSYYARASDDTRYVFTIDFEDPVITGTKLPYFDDQFSLFPNPVSDQFFIDFPEGFIPNNLQILNHAGQLVMELSLLEETNAEVSNLNPGLYICVVSDFSGNQLTKKFVVQRM